MPYNRDQVIAAVTGYYDFLTRLHVEPKDIRRPPPGGWSEISQNAFKSLQKSDTVIDLLKHLPYIENDENFSPILVYTLSGCKDYTGKVFQRQIGNDTGRPGRPGSIELEDCPWEKLRKPHPHIIELASPAVSFLTAIDGPKLIVSQTKYGDYIACDTNDGEFAIWSFWEEECMAFPNAEACFAYMKERFFQAKIFPVDKESIWQIKKDDEPGQEVKRLAEEHQWPSKEFEWSKFYDVVDKKRKEWDL